MSDGDRAALEADRAAVCDRLRAFYDDLADLLRGIQPDGGGRGPQPRDLMTPDGGAYAVRLPMLFCSQDGCSHEATFAVYDRGWRRVGVFCGLHAGELVYELNHEDGAS